MSEPLALLPFALAAGGGLVDGVEAQQWVAAGHTLLTRSASIVRTLAGARSAILLPPGGAFLSALAASDGRGAVLVNPLASQREIQRQLIDARVSVAFTNSDLSGGLPFGFPRVLLDDAPWRARVQSGTVDQTVDLGNHFGLGLEGSITAEGRNEEAVVVYTSAMAGMPLGAILTHRNLLFNARVSAKALGDVATDHCLAALPFAHLFGLVVCASAPLLAGARVTTMQRFHPARALELIEQEGITRFMGVPSMFIALLRILERRSSAMFNAHALRLCLAGGAPVAAELQDRWFDVTGVELRQGYGLTEAAPAALLAGAAVTNVRGTMGTALPGTEVTIREVGSGASAPVETEGEICVRGPHVFPGYVSHGEGGLVMRDGWLCTGDMGVQHKDGTVSFRRVLKPMFTRNGFNIYPREIEAAMKRMPGVHTAFAWGIPDDAKEHEIAVRVEGAVSEADVRHWARQELATYKWPSHIEVVSAQG